MISLEKWWILTLLQKLPKNVGDLENLLPKALKSCPKSNKLPNLVTLTLTCLSENMPEHIALRQDQKELGTGSTIVML